MLLLRWCSLLALMCLCVTSGFQVLLRNPSAVHRTMPLLSTENFARATKRSGGTALFDQSRVGLEGDPLEDNHNQRNRHLKKRLVTHKKRETASGDEKSKTKQSSSERKATTSTTGGVNMELKDPKERVLVRHATASSAYEADHFKGKKKKIIRPWSSARKKNKNKQNNTGGIAREAYGEELKVELKNKPKKKRLVMARTNSSGGSLDAAKALISGGSKADPLTSEDVAEERRIRNTPEDDDYDDNYALDDYDDDEPSLVRLSSSIVRGPEDGGEDEPNLVRLSSSIVREPEDDGKDEPNLVRLSSSIVVQPESDDKEERSLVRLSTSIVKGPEDTEEDEPNLVRLESSMVKDPEKEVEEELKFYTRSDTSGKGETKLEEQRLVRAVPAPPPSSSDEPKLVRPNLVRAAVEGPKLTRPNIVKARVEGTKLVRPNVYRAKVEGPKLVRANVDIEKTSSTDGPPLVRPGSSGAKRNNFEALDFMYGADASTASPTAVPMVSMRAFSTGRHGSKLSMIKDTKTAKDSEEFMYGSRGSIDAPSSVTVNSNHNKNIRGLTTIDTNNQMDNLMYGAKQAATSPTAVSVGGLTQGKNVQTPISTGINSMDDLMYGTGKATASPSAVPVELKSKNISSKDQEKTSEDSLKSSSMKTRISKASIPAVTKTQVSTSRQLNTEQSVDDLMYGYQRATSSPTSVKIETSAKTFVKAEIDDSRSSVEDSSEGNASESSTPIFPDGDKRKVFERRKRYVKPSISAMDNVIDWDAANPTAAESNPTSVKLDQSVGKKPSVVSHSMYGNSDGQEKKLENEGLKKKKYVQLSASLMDNAPDWDAVKPATSTSNPSVVSVEVPKSKDEVAYRSEEKKMLDPKSEVLQKKQYTQPSTSLMNSVPDWDAVKPASTTSNPSIVNVDVAASKKKQKDNGVKGSPKKKKFVQPSTSLMDNAPDWDSVKPATMSSNPSVVNIEVPELQKEPKYRVEEEKSVSDPEISERKKYYQPSTSLMDNAPDWDSAKPASTNSNPSLVKVDLFNEKKDADSESLDKHSKQKKYVRPLTSLMDSAPDWDAVQPAIATSNPSVVNVDGVKRIRKEKRFVRPSVEQETQKKKSPTQADVPFEYKQLQSIPKENPAGAKPIRDDDTKTKLPAAIAHAAGSTSDGWTPAAHFPSDKRSRSSDKKESNASFSGKKAPYYSTMENYDPDALPRPTGVIPLTVSSSTKEKTQLFRKEYSIEPIEEDVESNDMSDNSLEKVSATAKSEGSKPEGNKGRTKLQEKTVSPFTRNVDIEDESDGRVGN